MKVWISNICGSPEKSLVNYLKSQYNEKMDKIFLKYSMIFHLKSFLIWLKYFFKVIMKETESSDVSIKKILIVSSVKATFIHAVFRYFIELLHKVFLDTKRVVISKWFMEKAESHKVNFISSLWIQVIVKSKIFYIYLFWMLYYYMIFCIIQSVKVEPQNSG